MLFHYCRAQADTAAGDVVPMDLSMLDKGNGETSENSKDEDKKGKGKGKAHAKRTKLFPGYSLERLLVNESATSREGDCISGDADHGSCEHYDLILIHWDDVDTAR